MGYNDNQEWWNANSNSSTHELGSASNPIGSEAGVSAYLSKVFGWMAFALLLSGLAAWLTGHNEQLMAVFVQHYLFFGIAEIGLVIAISAGISRFSATTCTVLFVVYSVLNGLTLGGIFYLYKESSILSTFLVTALTFGAMAFYGYVTKKDLSKIGRLLFFALIGLVITSLVNLFMHSSTVEWVCSAVGVVVFIGLTAYDTQKIKGYAEFARDEDSTTKLAVMGALSLYLDFINLFLYLLRFMGSRRD